MRGPWYISVSAVRDYLWWTNRADALDGPSFDAAEDELIELATARAATGTPPKVFDNGTLQYRLPRAAGRLVLVVGKGPGSQPAVIAVEPGHNSGRPKPPHRNR